MSRAGVAAVVIFVLVSGLACGETKYYVEVKPGTSDYVTVVCAPEGNPLGFSMEFPRCYCNGGILLKYVVESRRGDRFETRFELKRGYLLEGGATTLVVSRDGRLIDHMRVGDRKITERDSPEIWRNNQRSFADLMTTFGAKFYEIEAMCRAEQGGDLPLTMDLPVSD